MARNKQNFCSKICCTNNRKHI